MIGWTAALQPLLIGVVLIWAAAFKLFSRHAGVYAQRSALVSLLGQQRALPAYRLLGAAELTIGTTLVLPPAWWVEAAAAAALTIGFLAYLGYARIAAPESSCGCLSASRAPVSWRSFARGGTLLLAAGFAVAAQVSWLEAIAAQPTVAAAVLLGESAVIVLLSPELDSSWLLPLRQWRVGRSHPLAGASFDVPLESSLQQLLRSGVYRHVAGALRSDVREHWDDDEWRVLVYSAQYDGRLAAAVFAVPRLRYEPGAVRVAIVDESTGETLLTMDGVADADAELGWPEPASAYAS
jgi:hypothetical protein